MLENGRRLMFDGWVAERRRVKRQPGKRKWRKEKYKKGKKTKTLRQAGQITNNLARQQPMRQNRVEQEIGDTHK